MNARTYFETFVLSSNKAILNLGELISGELMTAAHVPPILNLAAGEERSTQFVTTIIAQDRQQAYGLTMAE
jgi:hypothetical protein